MTSPVPPPTLTVAQLGEEFRRMVSGAFPDEVWVAGEIRDLSRHSSGHVYFSLVDPEDLTPAASASGAAGGGASGGTTLPVTLFATDKEAVNRVLIRSGAVRMSDGVHIRVRGRVNYYAPRGLLQLRMTWIDTGFTVGQMEAKRRVLLKRLDEEALIGRNAALPAPVLPLHIGLVTSLASAAHADFMREIEQSGFGFRITKIDARVQGVGAVRSLEAAIRTLAGFGVDAIALVRGGGAQTDLAAFDDEAVARAIALSPVPVHVGIGHEVDRTVADMVAAVSLKTPTACARYLVDVVHACVRTIDAGHAHLSDAARRRMTGADTRLANIVRRLSAATEVNVTRREHLLTRRSDRVVTATRTTLERNRTSVHHAVVVVTERFHGCVAAARRSVDNAADTVRRTAPRSISDAERRLAAAESLVRASEPHRMLARGWSVTHTIDGELLRSSDQVRTGTRLVTTVADGAVPSTVTDATMDKAERGET